eukprot:3336846-Rhodomonas_salina.1
MMREWRRALLTTPAESRDVLRSQCGIILLCNCSQALTLSHFAFDPQVPPRRSCRGSSEPTPVTTLLRLSRVAECQQTSIDSSL